MDVKAASGAFRTRDGRTRRRKIRGGPAGNRAQMLGLEVRSSAILFYPHVSSMPMKSAITCAVLSGCILQCPHRLRYTLGYRCITHVRRASPLNFRPLDTLVTLAADEPSV